MGTELRYGLQIRETGELARLHSHYNGDDRYACGEFTYRLSDDPDDPVFMLPREEELIEVLAHDTFWANSSETRPGWGGFSRDDLIPVRITTTVEVEAFELRMPLLFRSVESRDVPSAVARMRVPQKLPVLERYVQTFSFLPEGVSRADVEGRIGEEAFFGDIYTRRRILGVGDVPEEYLPDFEGRPGVTLICAPQY